MKGPFIPSCLVKETLWKAAHTPHTPFKSIMKKVVNVIEEASQNPPTPKGAR